MAKKDPRIDAYIAQSADFAKPILTHIRALVHRACPEVQEDIKWNFPHFAYKGLLCSMAAFKQHCAFGFWHSEVSKKIAEDAKAAPAMGQLGRITAITELPAEGKFLGYIREAARLNDAGAKSVRPKRTAKPPPKIPAYFLMALKKNKKALAAFQAFPPSHQREYVDWITEAKRPETRQKRIATAMEWLSKGKSRNWKYENC